MKTILKSVFAIATIICLILMMAEASTPGQQFIWSAAFGLLTLLFGKLTAMCLSKEELEEEV
jgi:hypothetical protein